MRKVSYSVLVRANYRVGRGLEMNSFLFIIFMCPDTSLQYHTLIYLLTYLLILFVEMFEVPSGGTVRLTSQLSITGFKIFSGKVQGVFFLVTSC